MPFVGQTYRFYYVARDRSQGLSDVRYLVIKPDGSVEGLFPMAEFAPGTGNALLQGIYMADVLLNAEGTYLFSATSLSQPLLDSKSVFAEAKTGYGLAVAEHAAIATTLLDLANGVEVGLTVRQAQQLQTAVLAGLLSGAVPGAPSTIAIRNAVADSKVRITAHTDPDGNRLTMVYDLS